MELRNTCSGWKAVIAFGFEASISRAFICARESEVKVKLIVSQLALEPTEKQPLCIAGLHK